MNSICVMAEVDLSNDPQEFLVNVEYPHATLLYMGKPSDYENYNVVIEGVADSLVEAIEKLDSIKATATKFHSFDTPNEDGKYPRVLLLDSPELIDLHNAIYEGVKAQGFEPTSEYVGKNYVPHITVGYEDEVRPDSVVDQYEIVFLTIGYSAGGEDFKFKLDESFEDDEDSEEKVNLPESQNPNAVRLRRYWTRGEGGKLKVRWGTPGDWTRCVKYLSKYVNPEQSKRMCANYHRTMTGMWPGDKRNKSDTTTLDSVVRYAHSLINEQKVDMIDNSIFDAKDYSMQVEHKSAVAGPMVSDPETGIVEAYVSVTGVVDNVNDIIQPGAYTKTLEKRTPKGVWSHDWNTPISKALDVKELLPGDPNLPEHFSNGEKWDKSAGALYVKMQFNMKTQRGRDAFEDVVFYGDQQEWSIGYNVPQGEAVKDKDTGIRHIKSLELFEFSPVLFGAATQARTKKSLLDSVAGAVTVDSAFLAEIKALVSEADDKEKDNPENANETEVGEVPEEDNQTQEDLIDDIEETSDELAEVQDNVKKNGLNEDLMGALRTLQEVLNQLFNASTDNDAVPNGAADPAQAPETVTEVKPTVKSMRKVMDTMIYDSNFDVNRLNVLDEGVRTLQKSIDAGDQAAVANSGDALVGEIEQAITSTGDEGFIEGLKKLLAAVAEALQSVEGDAVEQEQADVEEGSAPDTEEVPDDASAKDSTSDEEEKSHRFSAEEWKKLIEEEDLD